MSAHPTGRLPCLLAMSKPVLVATACSQRHGTTTNAYLLKVKSVNA